MRPKLYPLAERIDPCDHPGIWLALTGVGSDFALFLVEPHLSYKDGLLLLWGIWPFGTEHLEHLGGPDWRISNMKPDTGYTVRCGHVDGQCSDQVFRTLTP